jgi:hypothetical protein
VSETHVFRTIADLRFQARVSLRITNETAWQAITTARRLIRPAQLYRFVVEKLQPIAKKIHAEKHGDDQLTKDEEKERRCQGLSHGRNPTV